jgi:hypothetical protein
MPSSASRTAEDDWGDRQGSVGVQHAHVALLVWLRTTVVRSLKDLAGMLASVDTLRADGVRAPLQSLQLSHFASLTEASNSVCCALFGLVHLTVPTSLILSSDNLASNHAFDAPHVAFNLNNVWLPFHCFAGGRGEVLFLIVLPSVLDRRPQSEAKVRLSSGMEHGLSL